MEQALDAAATAQKEWAGYGMERKQAVLMAIGNELMARAEELGTLLSREEGKPVAEGKGEVYRAGQFFTFYAAECLRQLGKTPIQYARMSKSMCAANLLAPWRSSAPGTFPPPLPSWKCARTCYGNAVIWKPANVTPASAVALTEIISRQDIPAGLFNLVMGAGRDVGQRLVESPKINAISFTGSVPVGRGIAMAAVQNLPKSRPKWLQERAGGYGRRGYRSGCSLALGGAFGGSGQKCTASSRLIVHAGVHDAFVEKLLPARKP